MLKVLRERTKVVLWVVIVGFVGFIFAVWGAGLTTSRKRRGDVAIAEVEGRTIDYDSFNRAYRRSLAAARRASPEGYDDERMSRRVLDDTWNEFLSGVLLRREVIREGIRVSDKELLEHVLNNPPAVLREHEALQTDGEFDQEKYVAALRTPGQDWRWLEGYYANALPLLRLQRRVEASAYVSRWVRERQRVLEEQKATVSYLFFDPRRWETLDPEGAAALEQEMRSVRARALAGEEFAVLAAAESDVPDAASGGDMGWVSGNELTPPLREAVLSLEPGEISEVIRSGQAYHLFKVEEASEDGRRLRHVVKRLLIPVEPAEIDTYYRTHSKEFRRPALARVSFISVPKPASPADSTEIEAEIRELAQGIAGGDDFGDLATVYSDAPSASQEGDLGFLTEGTLKPGFDDALSRLQPGEVSEPFLTPEGWQLLKLEERKRESGETRIRARHIQLRIEPSEETLGRLLERTEDLAADATERGLGAVAADEGLEVRQSGTFSRSPLIPGLGELPRGVFWAHEADEDDVSPVLETDESYFILTVEEKVPEGISPLVEVRGRVEARLRAEKTKELARGRAEAVRHQLLAGATMEEVAAADTVIDLGETGPFGPGDYVPDAGATGEFHGAAFALEEGRYSPVVEGRRGFYILALLSREGASEEARPDQSSRILAAARARLQQEWFAMLIDGAHIEDYRDQFYML